MLEARQLDRDESSARWQVASGTYQVDFWKHLAYRARETPPEKVGHAKEAWLLTNARMYGRRAPGLAPGLTTMRKAESS
jgi:hypothetical protein